MECLLVKSASASGEAAQARVICIFMVSINHIKRLFHLIGFVVRLFLACPFLTWHLLRKA